MAKKTGEKFVEPTVVAMLTITSSLGEESVISFDRAWERSLEIASTTLPVSISFVGFVRK